MHFYFYFNDPAIPLFTHFVREQQQAVRSTYNRPPKLILLISCSCFRTHIIILLGKMHTKKSQKADCKVGGWVGAGGVNAYGQPDRKISAFLTTSLRR